MDDFELTVMGHSVSRVVAVSSVVRGKAATTVRAGGAGTAATPVARESRTAAHIGSPAAAHVGSPATTMATMATATMASTTMATATMAIADEQDDPILACVHSTFEVRRASSLRRAQHQRG